MTRCARCHRAAHRGATTIVNSQLADMPLGSTHGLAQSAASWILVNNCFAHAAQAQWYRLTVPLQGADAQGREFFSAHVLARELRRSRACYSAFSDTGGEW